MKNKGKNSFPSIFLTRLRLKSGFTLIELLIAIVVIGVLAMIMISSYQYTRKAARDSKRKSDLETIRAALEAYKSDHGEYPRGRFGYANAGSDQESWKNGYSCNTTANPPFVGENFRISIKDYDGNGNDEGCPEDGTAGPDCPPCLNVDGDGDGNTDRIYCNALCLLITEGYLNTLPIDPGFNNVYNWSPPANEKCGNGEMYLYRSDVPTVGGYSLYAVQETQGDNCDPNCEWVEWVGKFHYCVTDKLQ